MNLKKIMGTLVVLGSLSYTGYGLEVCTDGLNLRDDSLENVLTVLPMGTKIELLDEPAKTRSGYKYQKFEISGSDEQQGWLANDSRFICEPGAAQKRKIVISLSSNRLYYYENGSVVRSWNVGTARPGKVTPTGTFKIWNKDVCPPYYGSKGDKNVPGCTSANPFGPKALWFSGYMYGIHGTNEPWLLKEGTSASSRKVSSGCVRNENSNIEWLFKRVKVGDPVVIK